MLASINTGTHVKKWTLVLLVAAPAATQEISPGDMPRPKAVSGDSLDFSYRPSLGIASHSPAVAGVVEEEPFGTNVVNPAVFTVPNFKWRYGSGGLVYTSLMPQINLPDLYSYVLYGGGRVGGFGVQARMSGYSFGSSRLDTSGENGWREFAGEEYSLSVATAAFANRYAENYFGLTGKVVSAPIAFADQGLNRQGYLIDIGYYGKIGKYFRVGLSALNLGLPVAGIRASVHRDEFANGSIRSMLEFDLDETFLLTPPSFHLGLGFDHSLTTARLHLLRTMVTGAVSAEFERRGFEGRRTAEAAALEFRILNVLAPALGLAYDRERLRSSWILGLFLFNHLSLGVSILDTGDDFTRQQKTFSLEIRNPLHWSRRDLAWWFQSSPAR